MLDSNPSQIFGRLTATGQIFLTNPNGVYFSPDASLDVGGLIASTHHISNADFMSGNYLFMRNNATGHILNEAELKSRLGGYIALLAPEVRNNGVVVAEVGSVALSAGEVFDLKFDKNYTLASLRVEPTAIATLIENKNAVRAPGGLIILSAKALDQLQGSVVRSEGIIEATGLISAAGKIRLEAEKGQTFVSGTLDVSSSDTGGSIHVLGETVDVADNAHLNANGKNGGGEILVGGSWQNSDASIAQATKTYIANTAVLESSALEYGNGGTVVAWSDVKNPASTTRAYGSFFSKGGLQGGDGGRIETSGHWLDTDGVRGNASAPNGNAGEWLFDPYNITINTSGTETGGSFSSGTYTATATSVIRASTINTLLNADTNVTIQTGDDSVGSVGDIIVSGTTIAKTQGTGDATLRLNANRGIWINNSTIYAGSSSSDDSSNGKLNLFLNANRSGQKGSVYVQSSTIRTQGGYFKAVGGSNADTYLLGYQATDFYDYTSWARGFVYNGSKVYTNGGYFYVNARAGAVATSTTTGALHFAAGLISTGAGNVYLNGDTASVASAQAGYYNGVYIYPSATDNGMNSFSLTTTTGDINITGSAGGGTDNGFRMTANTGLTSSIQSTSGNVKITTVARSGSTQNYYLGAMTDARSTITTGGNVTIQFLEESPTTNTNRGTELAGPITANQITIESAQRIHGYATTLLTANRVVMAAKSYGYDFVTNNKIATSDNSPINYAIYVTAVSNPYGSNAPTGSTVVTSCNYPSTSCSGNDLTSGKWILRPSSPNPALASASSPLITAAATMNATPAPSITGLSAQSKTFGDANFSVTASSPSTGAFTYSSSNTAVATVNSSTGEVTIVGAGTATITATQAADSNYSSGSATYTVTVANATPSITGLSNQSNTFGDAPFSLTPLSTSAGAFTYTSSDTAVATVNSLTGQVTIVGAGAATITATQAAVSNYNQGSSTYIVMVASANPIITGLSNQSKTVGDAAFSLTPSSTSPGAFSYSSSDTAVATVDSSGVVTIVGAGTATILIAQAPYTNYNLANGSYTVTVSIPAVRAAGSEPVLLFPRAPRTVLPELNTGNFNQEIGQVKSEGGINPSSLITPKNMAKESRVVGGESVSAKPTALNSGNTSAVRGSQNVSVAVDRKPSVQQTGLVSVSVPKDMATFSFTLPKEASPKAPDKITLATGEPLPSWLVYSKKSNTLIASSVPNEAWPIKIRVTSGTTSTIIQISKEDLQK